MKLRIQYIWTWIVFLAKPFFFLQRRIFIFERCKHGKAVRWKDMNAAGKACIHRSIHVFSALGAPAPTPFKVFFSYFSSFYYIIGPDGFSGEAFFLPPKEDFYLLKKTAYSRNRRYEKSHADGRARSHKCMTLVHSTGDEVPVFFKKFFFFLREFYSNSTKIVAHLFLSFSA